MIYGIILNSGILGSLGSRSYMVILGVAIELWKSVRGTFQNKDPATKESGNKRAR